MKKLTGTFLIETGVVNRGDGIGNIASVKKLSTNDGLKVFFSPVSYKRALWNSLETSRGWNSPFVTKEGGVAQRTGTIIDSEEFDFGGTMVAKSSKYPSYSRYSTFLVDNGISINNFAGDMEFMTNLGLASKLGPNEGNIINKENFFGIYLMPFTLELHRVGVQEINTFDTKISQKDSLKERIKKIYQFLPIKDIELTENFISKVESINYDENKKTTEIILTKSERLKRIKELIEVMGDLGRRIEASTRNLSPSFAVFSLDYLSPKYLLYMKENLKNGKNLSKEEIQNFAQKEGKKLSIAGLDDYSNVISELLIDIEREL